MRNKFDGDEESRAYFEEYRGFMQQGLGRLGISKEIGTSAEAMTVYTEGQLKILGKLLSSVEDNLEEFGEKRLDIAWRSEEILQQFFANTIELIANEGIGVEEAAPFLRLFKLAEGYRERLQSVSRKYFNTRSVIERSDIDQLALGADVEIFQGLAKEPTCERAQLLNSKLSIRAIIMGKSMWRNYDAQKLMSQCPQAVFGDIVWAQNTILPLMDSSFYDPKASVESVRVDNVLNFERP